MIKLKWDSLVIQQQKSTNKNKALTKDEMKQMLQYGANVIFKATDHTISEAEIDDLLSQGEVRTEAINQKLQQNLKPPSDLANLNMDSINIFDFMQRDQERRQKDAQMLKLMAQKEQQQIALEYRGRRERLKQEKEKIIKKVVLPQHHFYHNKQKLL